MLAWWSEAVLRICRKCKRPSACDDPAIKTTRIRSRWPISPGGLRCHWDENSVPRLEASRNLTGRPPTAWFICPDFKPPSGGIRKLYRSVDVLNEAGFPAAIMHKRPGFRCTWFDNQTRVISSSRAVVSHRDVIVVPEIYGRSICALPRGVRQVIFNQNAYLMLESLRRDPAVAAPYIDNPDLSAVLVVSEDNARVVEYAFPGAPVRRIRPGFDPALFHPPVEPKQRRIAYMPRKRAQEAAHVLDLLRFRGVLDGWEIIGIDGRTEAEAANMLRATQIFLSFSRLEGLGHPPLEALACGALVIGYHGFGGREYFRPPFAIAVEDGDAVGFARAVENLIRLATDDPPTVAAATAAGARFIHERYSRDTERQDLLDVFVPLLEA
jgi:Glycosyl transferases group 1